jgi:hypothetical protein
VGARAGRRRDKISSRARRLGRMKWRLTQSGGDSVTGGWNKNQGKTGLRDRQNGKRKTAATEKERDQGSRLGV